MGLAHEKKSYLQEKANLFEIGSIYISMNEKEWRKVAAPAAPQRQSHNSRDCPDIFLLPRGSRNSLPERKGLPAR
ncbi:hypothetical protein [Victivallis sp.]|uniref:hypothetical protein n=1 Tax=Victivallis sp. TaxID=2049020 RepID=UPI003A952C7D